MKRVSDERLRECAEDAATVDGCACRTCTAPLVAAELIDARAYIRARLNHVEHLTETSNALQYAAFDHYITRWVEP